MYFKSCVVIFNLVISLTQCLISCRAFWLILGYLELIVSDYAIHYCFKFLPQRQVFSILYNKLETSQLTSTVTIHYTAIVDIVT